MIHRRNHDGIHQSTDLRRWQLALEHKIDHLAEGDAATSEVKQFGIKVESLKLKRGARYNFGVEVVEVKPGSIALMSGLLKGDKILEVNRRPVRDAGHFYQILSRVARKSSVLLLLDRQGNHFFMTIQMK